MLQHVHAAQRPLATAAPPAPRPEHVAFVHERGRPLGVAGVCDERPADVTYVRPVRLGLSRPPAPGAHVVCAPTRRCRPLPLTPLRAGECCLPAAAPCTLEGHARVRSARLDGARAPRAPCNTPMLWFSGLWWPGRASAGLPSTVVVLSFVMCASSCRLCRSAHMGHRVYTWGPVCRRSCLGQPGRC